jgi:serine/threonine-protein kinase RsbW
MRWAQQAVLSRLQTFAYEHEEIFAIWVCLQEALVNAIEHGNGNDPNKRVRMTYLTSDYGTWIRIEDQGGGFDPQALADPTSSANLDQPHGRGVFLMRCLMDRVEFNRRGNAVTMELVRRKKVR